MISQRNALCVSVDGNHKEEKEVEKKMKLSHPSNIFCMIYNHNRPICLCIFCRKGMHTQIDFHLGNIVKKNLLLFPSFECILPHCNSLVMTFLCCVNATSSKREGQRNRQNLCHSINSETHKNIVMQKCHNRDQQA